MSSACCEDLLEKLTSSDFTEILQDNVDHVVVVLEKDVFSPYFLELLKNIFGRFAIKLPIEKVDAQLLRGLLPCIHRMFYTSLSDVTNILANAAKSNEDVLIQIRKTIQVSLDILESLNEFLLYIITLNTVKADNVASLVRTLPSVLLAAFGHCRGSENIYGNYFSSSADILTTLFRKSYEISINFYTILNEHFVFEGNTEGDIELLVQVLQEMCSVGEIIVGLDIKTMLEQWKGLAKMLSKYSQRLKDRLDIASPIKFLISSLTDNIEILNNQQDMSDAKCRNRSLKMGAFILKILIKIIELYIGYLGDCYKHILELVLLLNRCSRYRLENQDEELERYIVVGAGPLLKYLYEDRQFIEEFSHSTENVDSLTQPQKVGLFFSLISLLKLLIRCEDAQLQETWLRLPLVSTLIQLFSKCESEVNFTMKIEGDDVYTCLVSATSAYMISTHSVEHFKKIETFLIHNLFNCHIETGILVSDLTCLLCRLTNEEVCLRELLYVCKALAGSNSVRPELFVLRVTAKRLFSLLSAPTMLSLESYYPIKDNPHLWLLFNHDKSDFSQISVEISNNLDSVQYVNFMNRLSLKASRSTISSGSCVKDLVGSLRKLWAGVECCVAPSNIPPDWWHHLLYLLVRSTVSVLHGMDNQTLDQILSLLSRMEETQISPALHFYISHFLKGLGHHRISNDSYQNTIFTNINNLLIKCLMVDDPLIRQIATENYVYFAHYSYHEEIISSIMADRSVQEYLSLYLRKVTSVKAQNSFSLKHDFVHKCVKKETTFMEIAQPSKKSKLDFSSNMNEMFCLLDDQIKKIKSQCQVLSSEEKDFLNSVIKDISEIVEKR